MIFTPKLNSISDPKKSAWLKLYSEEHTLLGAEAILSQQELWYNHFMQILINNIQHKLHIFCDIE